MRKYGLFNSHVKRIHVSALLAEVSYVLLLSAILGHACSIASDHSQAVFPKTMTSPVPASRDQTRLTNSWPSECLDSSVKRRIRAHWSRVCGRFVHVYVLSVSYGLTSLVPVSPK